MAFAPYQLLAMMRSKNRRAYRYHRPFRAEAEAILQSIKPSLGEISSANTRECDDYAHDVLGCKDYAPWLYVYSTFAGRFKEGWIPDNYYGKVVVPYNNGAYQSISSMKAINGGLFEESLQPDLAYKVNGLYLDEKLNVIQPRLLKELLFDAHESVIYKIEGSGRGVGIRWFHEQSFNTDSLRDLKDGVFQAPIEQHPFFDEFTPRSVATLRITSIIDHSGSCSIRGFKLRMGRQQEQHVQSATQVQVAICPDTGNLYDTGHDAAWHATNCHPDTGTHFAGKTIPNYELCIEAVKKLHEKIPFARCIGWDLTLDKYNQVKVMEYNSGHNGIKYNEAIHGPCFADQGWEQLWKK